MSHSFIQNCCIASFTASRMNSWTPTLHWSCLMLTMLPCLISSKQTVSSNQCICCYTGLKVIVAQDKTPKRGCRWPAVDNGVPVEGVQVFIYLGSKQSSNGYYRPDGLRRTGLACSVIQRVQNYSSLSISTKVHLYSALIRSVLLRGTET